MLINPGDLIPVRAESIQIPWTKRKSQILNFLHRGPVTFQTFVYDTNVGDISSLATYFNPERWSESDLNDKFGHKPNSDTTFIRAVADGGNNAGYNEENSKNSGGQNENNNNNGDLKNSGSAAVLPRLLLYPDHANGSDGVLSSPDEEEEDDDEDRVNDLAEKEKQTMHWVILQNESSEKNVEKSKPKVRPIGSEKTSSSKKETGIRKMEFGQPSTTTVADDVFAPEVWIKDATPPTDFWNKSLKRTTSSVGEFKSEIRRPSDLWRLGSSSSSVECSSSTSISPFLNSTSFWSFDVRPPATESTSSFAFDSSWPETLSNRRLETAGGGSTGWSSGSNSVTGSNENLHKTKTPSPNSSNVVAREDFLLGESFLQNLTDYSRNETLV